VNSRAVGGHEVDQMFGLPLQDLEDGLAASEDDVRSLAGGRIFLTGVTGFLGSWLLASLLHADARLRLGLRIVVVTRDPSGLSDPPSNLNYLVDDVRHLKHVGAIDFAVHGAYSSSSSLGSPETSAPAAADTIVRGTQAVIDAVGASNPKLLFLSSGAVYGPQIEPVSEQARSAPDPLDPGSAYAGAKRLAETLCAAAVQSGSARAIIGRLFAFVGPRIPLSGHFAAGNFIEDALSGRPITIQGDGRPVRSYLYSGDLPDWCWALLVRGQAGRAYNVGGDEPVTIRDLASRCATLADPPVPVEVLGIESSDPAPWYVPVTSRAVSELGLRPRTSLSESLRRTYDWNHQLLKR